VVLIAAALVAADRVSSPQFSRPILIFSLGLQPNNVKFAPLPLSWASSHHHRNFTLTLNVVIRNCPHQGSHQTLRLHKLTRRTKVLSILRGLNCLHDAPPPHVNLLIRSDTDLRAHSAPPLHSSQVLCRAAGPDANQFPELPPLASRLSARPRHLKKVSLPESLATTCFHRPSCSFISIEF